MSTVVLHNSINARTVEAMYARAMALRRDDRNLHIAEIGLRAARARDPRLLVCLEKAAEVMHRMHEEQLGQFQRQKTTSYTERVKPTEVQLWQEAFRTADAGCPVSAFRWIYGVAAEYAGLVQ